MSRKNIVKTRDEYESARAVLRILTRSRKDFQFLRVGIDNRLGNKANGEEQQVSERAIPIEDSLMLREITEETRAQEKAIEKKLLKVLRRFPIYNNWLEKDVSGAGTVICGYLIGEFDIFKADTVSKMWQYAGLNPGKIRGKKRVDRKDGGFDLVETDTLVRGDKLTPGFVSPFNKNLRTALCGNMADCFIKAQNKYALDFYYPYKNRLENSTEMVFEISVTGKPGKEVMWKDAKPAHRHRAAIRYMVKMFLLDLYLVWRPMMGLPVRELYAEEYLGKKHSTRK